MVIDLKTLYEKVGENLFYGRILTHRNVQGCDLYEITDERTGEILCSHGEECLVLEDHRNFKILLGKVFKRFYLRNDEYSIATGAKADAPEESVLNRYSKEDLIYWSNSCGELHYNGEYDIDDESGLPRQLQQAYKELWNDAYRVRCYLTEYKGRYGILLQMTYDETFARDEDMKYREMCDFGEKRAELLAEKLRDKDVDVIFGRDCHVFSDGSAESEFSVFLPWYFDRASVDAAAALLNAFAFDADIAYADNRDVFEKISDLTLIDGCFIRCSEIKKDENKKVPGILLLTNVPRDCYTCDFTNGYGECCYSDILADHTEEGKRPPGCPVIAGSLSQIFSALVEKF